MDSDPDNPMDVGPPPPLPPDNLNKKKQLEVLLVDSGDEKAVSSDSSVEIQEQKKRRKIVKQCIEPNCTNSRISELVTASSYVLSYYNIEYDEKKKRKVCRTCQDRITAELDVLVNKLEKKETLLAQPLPVARDVVMLDDSDEKSETDDSLSSEFEVELTDDSDNGLTPEQAIEKALGKFMQKIDINKQINDSIGAVSQRFKEMEAEKEKTDRMFNELEAEIDRTRNEFYKEFEPERQELEPLDIPLDPPEALPPPPTPGIPSLPPPSGASGLSVGIKRPPEAKPIVVRPEANLPAVPPQGVLEKPLPSLHAKVFHLRGQTSLNIWKEGEIDEILVGAGEGGSTLYKIKFEHIQVGKKMLKYATRGLRQLAYCSDATVKIPVGTRVIGLYSENPNDKGSYYAGIIAEPPKGLNNNRYLVFFDDGVARYIPHSGIRVVCQSSNNIADDIHPNSRDFIQNYLSQYPERPMVKLNVGQVVKTEFEGKWHITRVKEVDASLVKLEFDQGRLEWIYRGSTRLGPLFTELENQKRRTEQGPTASHRRQRGPAQQIIQYTRQANDHDLAVGSAVDADGAPARKQNVARKSMGNRRTESAVAPAIRWEYEGTISKVDLRSRRAEGVRFKKHLCSEKCIENPKYQYVEDRSGVNPLLFPIIYGWDRQVTKNDSKRTTGKKTPSKSVIYVAPCGRRLRNLEEVHRYLRITKSKLEIDFFNYDPFLKVFDEWAPKRLLSHIKDLSYGAENVPISCVSSLDNDYPEYVEYSTLRIPKEKVFINTDPEFLVGCDCIDDCQIKDQCSCHKLTIQGTTCGPFGKANPSVGYKFRRLVQKDVVLTGIYECNVNCKCAKTCLNRVAQQPLRSKLQVFKTEKRDWGVRTLCDMPAGAFICIYVGNLLESEEGNKQGQNFGDEYFADLDMIEVVESKKEGYESDVSEEEEEEKPTREYKFNYRNTYQTPADLSTDEDEDTSGEKSNDKDFNPKQNLKFKNKNTDRVSRSKIPQMDGLESTSASEPEEYSTQSTTRNINDLIKKPDPFKTGMVRRREDFHGSDDGPEVYVQPPGQVDGHYDDSDEDDMEILEEKRPVRPGFMATAGITGPKAARNTTSFKSTRKFFGHNEDAYIMDAKSKGNIGRYLNHSCGPNCFVQSVFVDTHDLRFHWVAFFSSDKISAGSELCWDYNYEVGSIPGKELPCECGAEECRGRLL